ncbi:hypothetical protein D3C71_1153210 [compost metagenome]
MIRAEIRVPQSRLTVCQLHRFQAFEKRRKLRLCNIADGACRREHAQLDHAFQDAEGLLAGLGQASLGQVDKAFDHAIGQLIGRVRQHQWAQDRHKWGRHQQGDREDVREHFFQVVPPGPAGHAVGVFGGDGDLPGIVENLVEGLPVAIAPQVIVEGRRAVGLDARHTEMQIGFIHRRFAPARQIGTCGSRLPFHRAQTRVQSGKKMPALLMGHELAEELLIAFNRCAIAQLTCQFRHEFQRRRVLLERVLRVMGHIGNHRDRAAGTGCIRRDQDDAAQARVHHRQVVIVDGFAVPLQP